MKSKLCIRYYFVLCNKFRSTIVKLSFDQTEHAQYEQNLYEQNIVKLCVFCGCKVTFGHLLFNK